MPLRTCPAKRRLPNWMEARRRGSASEKKLVRIHRERDSSVFDLSLQLNRNQTHRTRQARMRVQRVVRKRQQSVLGRVAVRTWLMLPLRLLIDRKTQQMRMGCSRTLSYLSSRTMTAKTRPKTASKFPRTRIQLPILKHSGSRSLVARATPHHAVGAFAASESIVFSTQ